MKPVRIRNYGVRKCCSTVIAGNLVSIWGTNHSGQQWKHQPRTELGRTNNSNPWKDTKWSTPWLQKSCLGMYMPACKTILEWAVPKEETLTSAPRLYISACWKKLEGTVCVMQISTTVIQIRQVMFVIVPVFTTNGRRNIGLNWYHTLLECFHIFYILGGQINPQWKNISY